MRDISSGRDFRPLEFGPCGCTSDPFGVRRLDAAFVSGKYSKRVSNTMAISAVYRTFFSAMYLKVFFARSPTSHFMLKAASSRRAPKSISDFVLEVVPEMNAEKCLVARDFRGTGARQ